MSGTERIKRLLVLITRIVADAKTAAGCERTECVNLRREDAEEEPIF
jgi:hypothetical protein